MMTQALSSELTWQVAEYVKAEKKFKQPSVIPDGDVGRTSLARLTSRLDAYLAKLDGDRKRTRALRDTLERLQFGMGLPVGPKAYTGKVAGAAGTAENVAYLREALIEAWRKIKEDDLAFRQEAYVPALHKRKLVMVGTATKQRSNGERRELRSAEQLRKTATERLASAAARRRVRPPSTLPPLTTDLIGQKVEVCYDIDYDDGEGDKYSGLLWYHGEIIRLGGREHGGGQKGTIIIRFRDGTIDSLLANRETLWEVEEAVAWCFERGDDDNDDDDDMAEEGSEEGSEENEDEDEEEEEEEEEEEKDEEGEMDASA